MGKEIKGTRDMGWWRGGERGRCAQGGRRALKKKGAWFSESPAPMEVTTAMRLTPFALHASITLLSLIHI
eukprot:4267134-Pleurochrysis_carterae.AAC.2